MPKTKDANSKKGKPEYHYWRVTITYSDNELSGHRVFKDHEKAEKFAAKQAKSHVVKKTTVEAFVKSRHDWLARQAKLKDKKTTSQ